MSAILHSDLFDFPSYNSAIAQARQETKAFIGEVGGVLKQLQARQREYNADLQKYVALLAKINVAQTNSATQLKNINDSTTKLIQSKRDLVLAEQGLATATGSTNAALKAIQSEFRNLKKEYDTLIKSNKEYGKEMASLKSKFDGVAAQVTTFNTAVSKTRTTTAAVAGSYKAMSQELNSLRNRLKEIPGAFNATSGALNKSNKEAVSLQHRIEGLDKSLKRADATMGQFGRSVGNYGSAFRNIGSQILGVTGPLGIVIALFGAFQKVLGASTEYENFTAGLRAVVDTQEELADTLNFLNVLASKYGQSLQSLAIGYKGLTAASKGTSLEGAETRRIFEAVIQAGTALKLSNTQVEGTLRALQQMLSKGKVSAEELRQQLAEHLPGAFKLFADAAGVSTFELDKMLKAGKVAATDVLPKVATLLQEMYGTQSIENAKGLTNETNRLTNAFDRFLVSFGKGSGLVSFWADAKRGLTDFFDSLTYFVEQPSFKTFMGMFSNSNKISSDIAKTVEGAKQKFQSSPAATRQRVVDELFEKRQAVGADVQDPSRNYKQDVDEMLRLKKRYANINKTYEDYLKIHNDLLGKERAAEILHKKELDSIKGEDDPDKAAKKAQDKAARELAARKKAVEDQQKLVDSQADLAIEKEELRLAQQLTTEAEFQRAKLRIITDSLNEQIRLENTLKGDKDPVKVNQFEGKKFEAEKNYTKFLQSEKDKQFEAVKNNVAKSLAAEKEANKQRGDDYEDSLDKEIQAVYDAEEEKRQIREEGAEIQQRINEEATEVFIQAAREAVSGVQDIMAANIDNRIAQLEDQKEKELAIAGNNAIARAKIEKDFEARIDGQRIKRAKQEKAFAAFQISINTAQAIARTLAEVPKGDFGITTGILVAAYAALGAVQLAAVLARPLPRFAKGTKSAPAGDAIVGEEGFELIERKGRMYVAQKPQITKMEGGETVYTHEESKRIIDQALKQDNKKDNSTLVVKDINQGKRDDSVAIMARAFAQSGISEGAMRRIMEDTVGGQPKVKYVWDSNGHRVYENGVASINDYMAKKHKFG